MTTNLQRILSYIFPIPLWRGGTDYNHDIRVSLDHGEPKLLVNGSRQSGAYIKMLWEKTFAALPLPAQVDQILVLGVGGGTVIKLLSTKYPAAHITAVDIDKTMIDIAKTYFGLGFEHHSKQNESKSRQSGQLIKPMSLRAISEAIWSVMGLPRRPAVSRAPRNDIGLNHLETIVADAAGFLPSEIKKGHRYNLIIADLFSGREIPAFVSTPAFIHNIKLVMRPPGQFVINYLREREYAPHAHTFRELLKQIFKKVDYFEINNNIFFSCA